jgi:hypothetical protein
MPDIKQTLVRWPDAQWMFSTPQSELPSRPKAWPPMPLSPAENLL